MQRAPGEPPELENESWQAESGKIIGGKIMPTGTWEHHFAINDSAALFVSFPFLVSRIAHQWFGIANRPRPGRQELAETWTAKSCRRELGNIILPSMILPFRSCRSHSWFPGFLINGLGSRAARPPTGRNWQNHERQNHAGGNLGTSFCRK
jgi:hypothetical protein